MVAVVLPVLGVAVTRVRASVRRGTRDVAYLEINPSRHAARVPLVAAEEMIHCTQVVKLLRARRCCRARSGYSGAACSFIKLACFQHLLASVVEYDRRTESKEEGCPCCGEEVDCKVTCTHKLCVYKRAYNSHDNQHHAESVGLVPSRAERGWRQGAKWYRG